MPTYIWNIRSMHMLQTVKLEFNMPKQNRSASFTDNPSIFLVLDRSVYSGCMLSIVVICSFRVELYTLGSAPPLPYILHVSVLVFFSSVPSTNQSQSKKFCLLWCLREFRERKKKNKNMLLYVCPFSFLE